MVRSLSDMIATSVEGFKLRPRWEELPSLLSRGIQCQVLVFKMTFPRSESLLIPSGGHRKETHSITWDRVVGPTHTHIHTHTPTHTHPHTSTILAISDPYEYADGTRQVSKQSQEVGQHLYESPFYMDVGVADCWIGVSPNMLNISSEELEGKETFPGNGHADNLYSKFIFMLILSSSQPPTRPTRKSTRLQIGVKYGC